MTTPAPGAQVNIQGLALRDRAGQVLDLDSDELGIQNIGGTLKQVNPDGTSAALGAGGFGSDTIVQLPNASAALVNALEVITSLTTNTPGAEASKWVFKLLAAGSQVTALDIRPGQVLLPAGTTGAPPLSFQANGAYGLMLLGSNVVTIINGAQTLVVQSSSVVNTTANYALDSNSLRGVKSQGSNSTLYSDADLQIGVDGALATNATVGFLDIPSCAGPATGSVTAVRTGKVAVVYDSTNNQIYVNSGGTWRKTAALT